MDEKKLLNDYEPLIRKLASEYFWYSRSASLELEDFMQEARLGFISSLRMFKEEKGRAFSSYVENGIRMVLRKMLNEKSRLVRIPKYRIEMISRISREEREGELTDCELSERTGLNVKDIAVSKRIMAEEVPLYLDSKLKDDEGSSLLDLVSDGYEMIEKNIFRMFLEEKMNELKAEDRYIVNSIYGAFGEEKKKKNVLSRELCISSRTLNCRFNNALETLKKAI